jgi:Ni,Fe-hydrogenase III large subunit/Ni,Fe-hydrogenase III component G
MSTRAQLQWQWIGGTPPAWRAAVEADQWTSVARTMHGDGARLLALWGGERRSDAARIEVLAAYLDQEGLRVTELDVPRDVATIPSIAEVYPAALRMERALHDLLGVRAANGDARPWLRHASWPAGYLPLRRDQPEPPRAPGITDNYAFVMVSGDGVHEIPVGPVHASIIEPGHFRFSVAGEKVLRLEQRLGYAHKGVERLFQHRPLDQGHRLAARICGDSTVAYSWAYCRALEGMSGCEVTARCAWLRALALELERIANHLGDLGALGNDAGFAFGLAQFSRVKEDLLRTLDDAFGQRYLMDYIVPGGVARDLAPASISALTTRLVATEREVRAMRAIYDDHPGVHDRFHDAGTVNPQLAARLGLTGLAGRASGQAFDLRVDHPWAPWSTFPAKLATRSSGDVLARVAVRFDEVLESIRICRAWLRLLPEGAVQRDLGTPLAGALAFGLVEGWRGPVFIALEAGAEGRTHRCHVHDPSWQNWPALEHAIMDNIVPDFPLINKSFNLAYSGHDL